VDRPIPNCHSRSGNGPSSDKLAFVNDDGKETPPGFRQRLDAPDDDFPNHMIASWPICLLKAAKRADRNQISMTGLMLQRTSGSEFRRVGIFDFGVKLDNYRRRKGPLEDARNETLS
jgi:hypothetical protein